MVIGMLSYTSFERIEDRNKRDTTKRGTCRRRAVWPQQTNKPARQKHEDVDAACNNDGTLIYINMCIDCRSRVQTPYKSHL